MNIKKGRDFIKTQIARILTNSFIDVKEYVEKVDSVKKDEKRHGDIVSGL